MKKILATRYSMIDVFRKNLQINVVLKTSKKRINVLTEKNSTIVQYFSAIRVEVVIK